MHSWLMHAFFVHSWATTIILLKNIATLHYKTSAQEKDQQPFKLLHTYIYYSSSVLVLFEEFTFS